MSVLCFQARGRREALAHSGCTAGGAAHDVMMMYGSGIQTKHVVLWGGLGVGTRWGSIPRTIEHRGCKIANTGVVVLVTLVLVWCRWYWSGTIPLCAHTKLQTIAPASKSMEIRMQ
jgi:hypothetical protein